MYPRRESFGEGWGAAPVSRAARGAPAPNVNTLLLKINRGYPFRKLLSISNRSHGKNYLGGTGTTWSRLTFKLARLFIFLCPNY